MKFWNPFSGFRLTATLLAGALATVAVVFWSSMDRVEALFEKNEALQRSLARLQEEEVVAYCWVLGEAPPNQRQLAWLDVPARGGASAQFRTLSIEGSELYAEGLIVKFPGALVADGEARSMVLWRRAFGSGQAPEDGIVLEEPGTTPRRYQDWLDVEVDRGTRERFWGVLWDLAHNPERLARLRIEAIYGNAISMQPRRGYFYTIQLSATGALSLQTRPMSEAPAALGQ
jgi:hypothetical protein